MMTIKQYVAGNDRLNKWIIESFIKTMFKMLNHLITKHSTLVLLFFRRWNRTKRYCVYIVSDYMLTSYLFIKLYIQCNICNRDIIEQLTWSCYVT